MLSLKRFFFSPAYLSTYALLMTFSTSAGTFENGIREAGHQNWKAAALSFRQYVQANPYDAAGYYNLGTSLASLHQYEKAVWAFEKSLKLDPAGAAVQNIQYCYARLGIRTAWEPALSYFQEKTYQLGIDTWTYLSVITALGLGILLFFFLAAQRMQTRKVFFLFLLLGLFLLIFNIYNAGSAYHFRYNETHAVLMQQQTSVYAASSGNKRIDLFLSAGARYELVEITTGRAGLRMENGSVV